MNPEPITVSFLNKYIKDKVAEDEYLNNVYVKGEISDDGTCGYKYVCYINKNLGDNGNDQPIHSYCQKEPKCLVVQSYESGPVGRVPDNIVRHDNNNNTPNEYSRYVTVH